jgi:hypothetical protein
MDYKWKLKGLSRKVDPESVVQELEKIENIHSKLTPELILETAREPENVLHKLFDWDNSQAAEKWRMHQARLIINNLEITVISNGEPRQIPVYEIVSKTEGYKHVAYFDKEDIDYVKQGIIQDLTYLKNKLAIYKEFSKITEYINMALTELT